MTIGPVLLLGFLLGMRHATDADHVVAVATVVSRERTLRGALPIGALWGVGHTLTILSVGGAIVFFGVVIPPRLGLGMEFSVALMLILLGGMNLRGVLRQSRSASSAERTLGAAEPNHVHHFGIGARAIRPLFLGVVHGLAGSGAIALLVLGTIREAHLALLYLVVFSVGTIAGMLLITLAVAMPFATSAGRFRRVHSTLAILTCMASMIFGAVLVRELGFVHGLFSANPHWAPE